MFISVKLNTQVAARFMVFHEAKRGFASVLNLTYRKIKNINLINSQ
jgi:hypothetical protein